LLVGDDDSVGAGAGAGAELVGCRREIVADRAVGQEERVRDGAGIGALGVQAEHLRLTCGQRAGLGFDRGDRDIDCTV
jgi:hypothetical protein